MKHLIILFVLLVAKSFCVAQNIEHPTFARSDSPNFHVEGIRVSNDTTYIKCSYAAEAGSWANISPNTYIEDVITRKKYNILRIEGIPFAPSQKHFTENTIQNICLYFPAIDASIINLIELEGEEAFNIYNISLKENYQMVYSPNEYQNFYTTSKKYEDQKDFINAVNFKLKQLEAAKYLYGTQSIFCGSIMYNLNLLYFQMEDYMNAIKWGEGSVNIIEQLPGNFQEDIARIYSSLMTDYLSANLFDKAMKYGEKARIIRRDVGGDNNPQYAEYLIYLARIYNHIGDFPKAVQHTKEALNIFKSTCGDHSYEYLHTLIDLTTFYGASGNTNEALKAGYDAVRIAQDERFDSIAIVRAGAYNNYSLALSATGKDEEAIEYAEKAIAVLRECQYTNSPQMITLLANTAAYYKNRKDTIQAMNLCKEAIDICQRISGTDNVQYADLLEDLGDFYRQNDPEKCINLYLQSMHIKESYYGEDNIRYANIMEKTAKYFLLRKVYFNTGDLDSITCYFIKASNIIKKHTNKSMLNLTKSERTNYWVNNYLHLFDDWIPLASYIYKTDSLNALAYDALLFSKGYQLGIENRIKRVLLNDNNKQIKDCYNEYLYLLSQQNQNNRDYANNDSLKILIEEKEQHLLQFLSRHEINYDVSWKDVKNNLKNDDIAIEFGSCEYNDSILYYAMVLNNKMLAPRCIPLFNESKLLYQLSLSTDNKYNSISQLIWTPLSSYIERAHNIYFSPYGILNMIGIEYLPINQKDNISSYHNIYRLSSTKEICTQHNSFRWKSAVLFGDLDYDFNGNLQNESCTNDSLFILSRSLIDSLSSRGTFEPLLYSNNEISQVSSILLKNKVPCRLYSKAEGTEASFKSLSNQGYNIIHIATHGMYINEDEIANKRGKMNLQFILDDNNDIPFEDKSLTHSFLVLSGGNRLFKHDIIPDKTEDGILTSFEISQLNLDGLDLVALSACQTAHGDITSEGVYGLQRGFKKAGANTILMSLDKVDDEATMFFMIEFYRSLMSGKTKLQSLKDAQKYLRSVENGKYDDPKYWASFIMLDGLN